MKDLYKPLTDQRNKIRFKDLNFISLSFGSKLYDKRKIFNDLIQLVKVFKVDNSVKYC